MGTSRRVCLSFYTFNKPFSAPFKCFEYAASIRCKSSDDTPKKQECKYKKRLRERDREPEVYKGTSSKSKYKMPSLEPQVPFKKATFGMGCFWANDALFGGQQGVLRTRVGYSGGTTPNPIYKNIRDDGSLATASSDSLPSPSTSNSNANPRGDHTEVIEIDYDPTAITYKQLLKLFWDNHEYGLTTIIKRQYMSLILYHDEEQKRIAELDIKIEAGKRNEKLVTEIAKAGPFYPAEDYHQKYRLQKHKWIVEELNITPDQLQTSHVAAKLNGYVSGVGKHEDMKKDMELLGIPEKIASFVKIQFLENEGGGLYC